MKKFKIEGEITHYYEFEIEAEDEEHAEELGYEAIHDEDPYQQDVMELSVVEIEQEPVLKRYAVCVDTARHYGWFIKAENEEEAKKIALEQLPYVEDGGEEITKFRVTED